MNNYSAMMDAHIANAERAYTRQEKVRPPADPFNALIMPTYRTFRWAVARNDVGHLQLMTVLALHAFHLKQGRYPATLNELVPEYLQRVPVDPFDDGAPLHYRRRDDKYALWSIGPDGVDNGGVPIDDGSKEKNRRYVVLPDGKGDIVAGINR
mgnify:CR=1 FL=1